MIRLTIIPLESGVLPVPGFRCLSYDEATDLKARAEAYSGTWENFKANNAWRPAGHGKGQFQWLVTEELTNEYGEIAP